MREKKIASFWETEKEIRTLLLHINNQLELTHQELTAQMPKLQDLFLQFMQLGEELGFNENNRKDCHSIGNV